MTTAMRLLPPTLSRTARAAMLWQGRPQALLSARPLSLLAAVQPPRAALRPVANTFGRRDHSSVRLFATEPPKEPPAEDAAAAGGEAPASADGPATEQVGEAGGEGGEGGESAPVEPEDPIAALTAELAAEQAERAAAEQKTSEYKDAMLRALADAENARNIARRDVANARKFGVQNFAKDILDVADNLERAMGSVPAELRTLGDNPSPSHTALVSLYEGVNMTEKQMQSIMGRFGISKIDPLGEKVDPNRHDIKVNLPAGGGACCAGPDECLRCLVPPPASLVHRTLVPALQYWRPMWLLTRAYCCCHRPRIRRRCWHCRPGDSAWLHTGRPSASRCRSRRVSVVQVLIHSFALVHVQAALPQTEERDGRTTRQRNKRAHVHRETDTFSSTATCGLSTRGTKFGFNANFEHLRTHRCGDAVGCCASSCVQLCVCSANASFVAVEISCVMPSSHRRVFSSGDCLSPRSYSSAKALTRSNCAAIFLLSCFVDEQCTFPRQLCGNGCTRSVLHCWDCNLHISWVGCVSLGDRLRANVRVLTWSKAI